MTALLLCALAVSAVAGARGTWSPCGLSMTSAMNPVSEAARGHRYGLTCTWFVLGATVGGLTLGAVAAVLALAAGALPVTSALALAAAAALVTLAADLRAWGFHLPTVPRQVDETWFGAYRRWVYAVGFGLQIGAGLTTYVMTAATYLLVVLAALTGEPVQALAVGAVFGVVRGLAVLLSARATTPERLRALHRRLDELAPWSLRAAMATQAVVAVVLGGAATGAVGAGVVAALVLGLVVATRPGLARHPLSRPAV